MSVHDTHLDRPTQPKSLDDHAHGVHGHRTRASLRNAAQRYASQRNAEPARAIQESQMGRSRMREQIRSAWVRSGLTLPDLLRLAGLEIDSTSLGRKLSGKQMLRLDEAEALARALKTTISNSVSR
jgi:hypothetical protein